MRCFFCEFLFCVCVCLCDIVLSVSHSFVVTCWERTHFLALLYVMFSSVFVTIPYGILGPVWYLSISIPDRCASSLLLQHKRLNLYLSLGTMCKWWHSQVILFTWMFCTFLSLFFLLKKPLNENETVLNY